MAVSFTLFITFGLLILAQLNSISATTISRAKIETCGGCKLNRLPELKAFIHEDFVNYENTELKLIPGASPELIFFDKHDVEVKRINLEGYNREECNALLEDHKFQRKQKHDL
uniref:Selenoprotein M n=1 Tax=Photinus pyralis TaxID=7054 RepID=A0A1Y1KQU1_PHOPY